MPSFQLESVIGITRVIEARKEGLRYYELLLDQKYDFGEDWSSISLMRAFPQLYTKVEK